MRRRKIKDEADAVECLAAVREAGVDAVSWAQANGVDARSLNAWRMNLGRRWSARPTRATLVELVAAPAPKGGARYALVVGEARLEFGDDCLVDTLSRVIPVLRGC